MRNQKKIIFDAVGLPISSRLTVMLFFDDKLFQCKACVLKNLHDIKAHGDHAAFLTSIAHENSTKLVPAQQSHVLRKHRKNVKLIPK